MARKKVWQMGKKGLRPDPPSMSKSARQGKRGPSSGANKLGLRHNNTFDVGPLRRRRKKK